MKDNKDKQKKEIYTDQWMESLSLDTDSRYQEVPPEEDGMGEHKKARTLSFFLTGRRITIIIVILFLISLISVLLIFSNPESLSLASAKYDNVVIIPMISIIIAVFPLVLYIKEVGGEITTSRKYHGDWQEMKFFAFRRLTYGIALILSGIFALFSLLAYKGSITFLSSLDFMILTVIGFTTPVGIYYTYYESRREELINKRIPELLLDLAETVSTGLPLHKAIKKAADGNYGIIQKDLEKLAAHLEWGLTLPRALKLFGERVKTPLTRKSIALIAEASVSGGKISDVLHGAAKDAQEIEYLNTERSKRMSTYMVIIYISFMVFLLVVSLLMSTLAPIYAQDNQMITGEAEDSELSDSEALPESFSGGLSEETLQTLEDYSLLAIFVQGIGGGIMVGVMLDGTVKGGFKHISIMLFTGLVLFNLVV